MPLKSPELTKFSTASPILANYDYLDIEEGVGYVEFYAGEIADDSGVSQVMSRRQFQPYSEGPCNTGWVNGRESRSALPSISGLTITKTFELEAFKASKSIKGDINIQIPYAVSNNASNSEWDIYVTATIYKNAASIATETSQTAKEPKAGQGVKDGMFSFNVSVPRTNFAVGDQLKIKLDVYGVYAVAQAAVMIVHDPYARDIAALSATGGVLFCVYDGGAPMKFKVPFELNL